VLAAQKRAHADALLAHMANGFLDDRDAVALARCDTRRFRVLRRDCLIRRVRYGPHLQARQHAGRYAVGQVAHAFVSNWLDFDFDLRTLPRLSCLTIHHLDGPMPKRVCLPDSVRDLTLDVGGKLAPIRLPPLLERLSWGVIQRRQRRLAADRRPVAGEPPTAGRARRPTWSAWCGRPSCAT